jgi:hypothetical protein
MLRIPMNLMRILRIHVQVLYAGSEFERPEERARQASKEVNWLNKSELHALELSIPLLRIPSNLARLPETKPGDYY